MQIGALGYSSNSILFGAKNKGSRKKELKQNKATLEINVENKNPGYLKSEYFKMANLNIAKGPLNELLKPLHLSDLDGLYKDYNTKVLGKIEKKYGYFTPVDMSKNNRHLTVPEHQTDVIAAFNKRGVFTAEETKKKNEIVNQLLAVGKKKTDWQQKDMLQLLQDNKDFQELPNNSPLRNAITREFMFAPKTFKLSENVYGNKSTSTTSESINKLKQLYSKNSQKQETIFQKTINTAQRFTTTTLNLFDKLYSSNKLITSAKVTNSTSPKS